MNVLLRIACIVFFPVALKAAVADADSRKKMANYLAGNADRLSVVWSMTPAERVAMSETIKALALNEWKRFDSRSIRSWLVMFGDEEATRVAVEAYKDVRPADMIDLPRTGSPLVVEMLVPEIFREEKFMVLGGDSESYPPSYDSAVVAIALISQSPAFNAEVMAWAQRTSSSPYRPLCRNIMRDWWRENEPFFKAKNYKAARPGWEPPRINSPEAKPLLIQSGIIPPDENPTPSTPPAIVPPAPATPLPTPPPPSIAPPEVPPAPNKFTVLPVAVLAGALCLLILGVLVGKYRKRS